MSHKEMYVLADDGCYSLGHKKKNFQGLECGLWKDEVVNNGMTLISEKNPEKEGERQW